MSSRGFSNLQSVSAPTKRSACGRCRAQKLRCTPGPNGDMSCARCIHHGIECSKTFTKPSGMAPLASKRAHGQLQPSERPTQTQNYNPNFGAPTNAYPPLRPMLSSPQIDVLNDTLKFRGTAAGAIDGSVPSAMDYDSFLSDTYSFSEGISIESFGNSFGDILPSTTEMNVDTPTPDSGIVVQQTRRSSKTSDVDSVDEAGRVGFNLDDDTSLSSLVLRLSQYKRQYRFPSLMHDARVTSSGRTDEDAGSERSSGYSITEKKIPFGFGDALGGLSELLSLLSSYAAAVNAPENSSTKPVIGLVATLKMISAYLQIVDLFDNLFASLHEQMVSIGYVELQILPGLSLGNSAIDQGNLQTKILLQVVIHQFETIERVLGLPVELRVSGRKETYLVGLLDGGRARGLVMSLIGGNTVSQSEPHDTTHLASLRSNLAKVKRLLDFPAPRGELC